MKSILIIDDDDDIGDALLTSLKAEGYDVRLASSGKQGLALARTRVPQVILLDWQMPHMNGHQVLLALASRAKLRNVPVILMSANIGNIPAAILNTTKHLAKPFDLDVMLSMVAQAL